MSKTSRVKDVHYQVYKHLSGMSGTFSSRMRKVGEKEVLESTRPETPFSSQSPCVLLFHLSVNFVLFPSNPTQSYYILRTLCFFNFRLLFATPR
jgi:hypothetical protein